MTRKNDSSNFPMDMTTTTRPSLRRRRMVRKRPQHHRGGGTTNSTIVGRAATPACCSSTAWLLILLTLSNSFRQTSAGYQYENPYASNNNNNNNNYGGYSSYGGSAYSYGGGSSSKNMPMNVCQDSVVRVTKVEWACDSPYTFYYGNGAHRSSATCDYGDKISLAIKFQVVANIEEVNDIFMTMAVYDAKEMNLLSYTTPDYLCKNYVNSQCTYAGTYYFTTKLTLTKPYSSSASYYNNNNYNNDAGANEQNMEGGGNNNNNNENGGGGANNNNGDAAAESSSSSSNDDFYPQLHMAFSTKMDSGYNLGALNVECEDWDEQFPSYVAWSNQRNKTRTRKIFGDYGMLMGTSLLLFSFVLFVWKQAKDTRRGMEFVGYNTNLANLCYQQPPPPPPASQQQQQRSSLHVPSASPPPTTTQAEMNSSGYGGAYTAMSSSGNMGCPANNATNIPSSLSSLSRQKQKQQQMRSSPVNAGGGGTGTPRVSFSSLREEIIRLSPSASRQEDTVETTPTTMTTRTRTAAAATATAVPAVMSVESDDS